ncbi:hypothetical protein SAMN04487948_101481 [Halogranum amylolyticum]|uniref:Uncharacterized protein n=1 Tax=Halogranum amylolyticum TaxID=660520 RepID=A0A1H8NDP8_9EURY|nr:hypothetical protein [Halogranum amylolyticum]SEO27724.1 hypothetical protein SAMN04487948_101481 [Halogranum amylolyticum]
MTSRSDERETAHDTGVAREAEELERAGWTVTAAVPGWDDPDRIDGYVPDIVATKRSTRRVIEVETDTSADQDRHTALRDVADRRRETVFYVILVDSNGRRVQYTDALA